MSNGNVRVSPRRRPLAQSDLEPSLRGGPAGSLGVTVAGLLLLLALASCGGRIGPSIPPRVQLQGQPVVAWDPATGKTTVVVDFSVRDGTTGAPLDPSRASLRRLVDGEPADVESVPDFTDTKLATNLRLGMVLDASYSMVVSTPPAFGPMKSAVAQSLKDVRQAYATWNAGVFTPWVSWFQDQYVCVPPAAGLPDDAVLDLPTPPQGASTRLYAAALVGVDALKAMRDATPSGSATERYALVLFTDGRDNYSDFDSSGAPTKSVSARGGAWTCNGTPAASRETLLAKLASFPDLTVHVIGLGSDLDAAALRAIADAGHGRFVTNPDTGAVSTLFSEVTQEFTTLRRDGITMPLPAGEYEYVEEITVDGATRRIRFRFQTGSAQAGLTSTPTVEPGD